MCSLLQFGLYFRVAHFDTDLGSYAADSTAKLTKSRPCVQISYSCCKMYGHDVRYMGRWRESDRESERGGVMTEIGPRTQRNFLSSQDCIVIAIL